MMVVRAGNPAARVAVFCLDERTPTHCELQSQSQGQSKVLSIEEGGVDPNTQGLAAACRLKLWMTLKRQPADLGDPVALGAIA